MKIVGVFCIFAVAAVIPMNAAEILGYVGVEFDTPNLGQEDVIIYNNTGPTLGCSTPGSTPICTSVTFLNTVLTVNGIALQLGNLDPGIAETYTFPSGTFTNITSLALTTTLSNGVLTDDKNQVFTVNKSIAQSGLLVNGTLTSIVGTSVRPSAVPEPASSALVLLAVVSGGLLGVRRFRRASH